MQPRTLGAYRKRVSEFLDFAEESGLAIDSTSRIDLAFVKHLSQLFFEGYESSAGTYVLVGWQALFAQYGSGGAERLPRAFRALKGWRRLAPPRSRVGVVSMWWQRLLRRWSGVAGPTWRYGCLSATEPTSGQSHA